MASINLILQGTKNPAVIYIRLRDGRKVDIKAKTNYHINPADWDEKEQRPVKKLLKNIDYANLDTDLSGLKISLLTEYNKSKTGSSWWSYQLIDAYAANNLKDPRSDGTIVPVGLVPVQSDSTRKGVRSYNN